MNEGRGFSGKDVLLQGLFVVVFVFILIWLFPMKGDVKKALDPLYQRIFNENVVTIENAAKSYYTTARLPQKVGDTVYMSLADMLDKKLILPFVDSNDNQCDLNNSYVEVTKMDDEYNLKVNLQCSDKSDYVVTHMGCYSYCETAICEKAEETTKPVNNTPTTTNPAKNTNNNNGGSSTTKPSKGVTYYQYYTQTVEKVPYETTIRVPYSVRYTERMCKYQEVSRKTKDFYSVSYVGATDSHYNDNFSLHYGFVLSSNATNVKLKDVDDGHNYFSLSAYLSQKNNGVVYDYTHPSPSYSAYVPSSTMTFNKTSLSSSHITSVYVNDTTNYNNVYISRDWNVYSGYKFDYRYYLSDSRINNDLDEDDLVRYYDYNQGYIFFVPIRFTIQYDVLSGDIEVDECDDLNSAEEDYIIDRYTKTKYKTEYRNETKVEYKNVTKNSEMKWTTKKGVSGYIYTGATKVVK